MRDIEFRAWDGEKIFLIGAIDFALDLGPSLLVETTNGYSINVKCTNIMQYTGLRDKTGKKIYEGDICRQVFNKKETIGAVTINPTSGTRVGLDGAWPHDIEIIGNIHDNPELLKEAA